jgi:hypothetical protein
MTMDVPDGNVDPNSIHREHVPRRVDPAASAELEGDEVLYLEAPPRLFVLNPQARIIWHNLDGTLSVGQLADELAAEFGVPAEDMTSDVVGLVRELGASGLLQGVDADPVAIAARRVDGSSKENDGAVGAPPGPPRYSEVPPNR